MRPQRTLRRWYHTGDYLAAVAAVNAKVGIGRENDRIGKYFSHTHEASIGEAHRDVCVFLHERQHRVHIVVEVESDAQDLAAKQRAESRHPAWAQQMEGLRQDGFAGAPGGEHDQALASLPIGGGSRDG